MLHLQHLLFELGMSGSIGKALDNLWVLELATFQVSGLEEHFLNIGRDLTTESLEYGFGWIRVIYELSYVLSLDFIFADVIPSGNEELASSSSSSKMSMAKENKLLGESCSWKKKRISYPRLSIDIAKFDRSDDLLLSEQFLVSGMVMQRVL